MNQTINYIKELTAIASPTGFTREISDYLVYTLEKLGYQPIRTAKGGPSFLILVVPIAGNELNLEEVTAFVSFAVL